MSEEQFTKLLKSDHYQVFLFVCPAFYGLVRHPWFVVNDHDKLSRWEVFWRPEQGAPECWGHLHKDFYKPTEAIHKSHWPYNQHKTVVLRGMVEGGEGSLAAQMAATIKNSPSAFNYCNHYALRGPNSNTYAQWVIDQFPEAGFSLPWRSFGKGFMH